MANDRMYLRCMCKEDNGIFLGKTMSSGYYTDNYQHDNTLIERLNGYFDKHSSCGFELNEKMGIDFDQHYYICYDGDELNNSLKKFLSRTKDKELDIIHITNKMKMILGFKPYEKQVTNIINIIKKEIGGHIDENTESK